MKRNFLYAILITLLNAGLCHASDFRKGNFGMTFEEIKTLEPNFTHSAERQALYGEVKLVGLKAVSGYNFINGIFTWGTYAINENYKNPQIWINKFVNLELFLKGKYGTPDEEQVKNWTNALYKDKRENWGTAIQKGHLEITSRWKKPDKIITLSITGPGYDYILLTIMYISLEHFDLMAERNLKDL